MKKFFASTLLLITLTSCTGMPTDIAPTLLSIIEPVSDSPTVPAPDAPTATTAPIADDFFTQNGITLPEPLCSGLTQPLNEGPYYIPNSPERNSLYEAGMPGTRLIVAGYVLD